MGVLSIIEGHTNELLGLHENLSERRMNICKVCPIFLNEFGGICNRKLWINPNTNDINFGEKEGYIRGCGCRLKAKTTIEYEKCPAGKW